MIAGHVHGRARAAAPTYSAVVGKAKLGGSAEQPIPVGRVPRRVSHHLGPIGKEVWIEGEIQDVRWSQARVLRFSLRENGVRLECVAWRREAARLSVRFRSQGDSADLGASRAIRPGDLVVVRGRLSLDGERVAVRFAVVDVRHTGVARAEVERERVRRVLERDGLLCPSKKRPLPRVPRRIALITSLGSAAEADVLSAACTRHPGIRIDVIPAVVQGAGAPQSLIDALDQVPEADRYDLVLVCRGGGSAAELAAFDDEGVARAIARCPVPVVTGIGHETDTTLADCVADRRAPTPTAAAVAAIPLRGDLEDELAGLERRLRDGLGRRLAYERARVQRAGNGIGQVITLRTERAKRSLDRLDVQLHAVPRQQLAAAQRTIDRFSRDLPALVERSVDHARTRRALLAARLAELGPTAMLARGYAIPRSAAGAVLKSAADFSDEPTFMLTVAHGEVQARVLEVVPHTGRPDHDNNVLGERDHDL